MYDKSEGKKTPGRFHNTIKTPHPLRNVMILLYAPRTRPRRLFQHESSTSH